MAEITIKLVQNLIDQAGNGGSRGGLAHSHSGDIIVLGQQGAGGNVIDVNGRVISVHDGGGFAGYDSVRTNYSFGLTGDNNLTISGNYGSNTANTGTYTVNAWDPQFNTMDNYKYGSTGNNARVEVNISTLYNAYNFVFNSWNGSGDADAAGAIYFGGDNTLTLTAQAGAEQTQRYWDHSGTNGTYWKTDDGIKLRSENFAIYGYLNRYNANESRSGTDLASLYNTERYDGTHTPTQHTESYVINHVGGTLTVASDLAGEITANVAAIHTGYITPIPEGSESPYAPSNDDSNGNVVKASGVKSNNLTLNGNFRAVINVKNNKNVIDELYDNNPATTSLEFDNIDVSINEKRMLYRWNPSYAQDGKLNGFTFVTAENPPLYHTENVNKDLSGYGTVIAGFATESSNKNTI